MQSVRISKRRLRRIKKKRNHLTWQVIHSHCEHNVRYYLLLCLAFLLDMICGIFALICKLLCYWLWMGLVQPVAANRGRSWICGRFRPIVLGFN